MKTSDTTAVARRFTIALRCVLGVSLGWVPLAPAQITITASDIASMLTLGTSITSQVDTSTRTMDIGAKGSTTWDFSAAVSKFSVVATSVRPDTTPYAGAFPGATHAQRIGVGGLVNYSYLKLDTDLLHPGIGTTGFFQQRTSKTPDEILYRLPLTMGTSWSTSYVESTIVTSPPIVQVSQHVVDYEVDAFGDMTLPGGSVHAALRLRVDHQTTANSNTVRSISYIFIARNGAMATVVAMDTLQANSGSIAISSILWNAPIATGIASEDRAPGEFRLEQNYPNPFNPTTNFRFTIDNWQLVVLKVYDALGREVATIVNEEIPAGEHTRQWDAAGLPSGIYYCKLSAGSLTQTRKLALTK